MSDTAQNAIQQDALEQSEIDSGAANANNDNGADEAVSPRMSEMERIAEGRRRSMEAEGVDFGAEADAVGEPRRAEAEKQDEPDQLAAQLAQDERTPTYADPALRVKVKVDGEELELPLAEVVKSYQKDAAASRRLTEATRL